MDEETRTERDQWGGNRRRGNTKQHGSYLALGSMTVAGRSLLNKAIPTA